MVNLTSNNSLASNEATPSPVLPTDFVLKLITSLKPRTRDIIAKRFGLDGDRYQTLEEIGRKHDITRERVRQIESSALKDLKKSNRIRIIEPCELLLESIIAENGKVMEHNRLVDTFIQQVTPAEAHANVVNFILTLSDRFKDLSDQEHFYKAWAIENGTLEIPQQIVSAAYELLKSHNQPLAEEEIVRKLLAHSVAKQNNISDPKHIKSYLNLSKKIRQNPFTEWGFSHWSEIIPKGVKDKAYLVLKKSQQPLHFREITNKINATNFSGRSAIPQTVHNELIKDDRFILVGRGIYGLAEWGYTAGTVADVVTNILTKAGAPMKKEEVIGQVLKQRLVKRNTVALALQNPRRFKKVSGKSYTLA